MRGATRCCRWFPCPCHFYSRTSCEVQHTLDIPLNDRQNNFYSRTSCEVQREYFCKKWYYLNFYSRTSCEVQRLIIYRQISPHGFLLTHLMRGATKYDPNAVDFGIDFYSRTSCEVQLKLPSLGFPKWKISTHAPHARCNAIWEAV